MHFDELALRQALKHRHETHRIIYLSLLTLPYGVRNVDDQAQNMGTMGQGIGAITYAVSSPPGTNVSVLPTGTKVPDRAVDFPLGSLPEGVYGLIYSSGGPPNSVFTGVSPAPTQVLETGGAISFTFQFASSTVPDNFLLGTNLPLRSSGEMDIQSSGFVAQQFSLTTPATLTEIDLQLAGFGTSQVTIWLTNSLGTGTSASNVLLRKDLTFPNTGGGFNGATVTVPVQLSLPPSTYYLVLSSTNNDTSGQGWAIADYIIQTSFGSVVQEWSAEGLSVDHDFPPASAFVPFSSRIFNMAFQLIGSEWIVPEL